MKRVLLIAALFAAGAHNLQKWADTHPLPTPATLEQTLPSPDALRLLSLGFHSLVADIYWLRALSHFGSKRVHAAGYPNLQALIERVVHLDPYFADAYFFAGCALSLKGQNMQAAVDLLKQGRRYRPDDWRIAFMLGFNAYFFLGHYALGAEAIGHAAKLEGAPDVAGPLAMRLAAHGGEPEMGLQLAETLLGQVTGPRLVEMYQARRQKLLLELHLKHLNAAAKRYRERTGKAPEALPDLVGPGLLQRIPEEPLGGRFFVDDGGRVRTTSESKRLRLKTPPRSTP